MEPIHSMPVVVSTPADFLRLTALYLERHGWTQRSYYAPTDPSDPTPPACVAGALGLVVYGEPLPLPAEYRPEWAEFRAAENALREYLDQSDPDGDAGAVPPQIHTWNDRPGRTASEIIETLRTAAAWWDATQGGTR